MRFLQHKDNSGETFGGKIVKKQILTLLLCLIVICTICAPYACAEEYTSEFAGGCGTIDDPYLISTPRHLNNVRNHLDAHFALIMDITFTESDFAETGDYYNEGAGWLPIGATSSEPFSGTFNGNAYTIGGLRISAEKVVNDAAEIALGVFGYSSGYICNLTISSDCIISAFADQGYVGGAVGNNMGGVVSGCYNESAIYVESTIDVHSTGISLVVGGIAGTNSGEIRRCSNSGAVTCATSSSLYSYGSAGGITGTNSGNIVDCYNSGEITSALRGTGNYNTLISRSGGVSGTNAGAINKCFNYGNITAFSVNNKSQYTYAYSGGIAGSMERRLQSKIALMLGKY